MGTFYVVSKSSPDATEYETAVVFNATHKDADNESAANEYRTECGAVRPWQTHTVMSAEDFADAYPEKSDADPVPGDATDDGADGTADEH